MRAVALISLATGAVVDLAFGQYAAKDRRISLLRKHDG